VAYVLNFSTLLGGNLKANIPAPENIGQRIGYKGLSTGADTFIAIVDVRLLLFLLNIHKWPKKTKRKLQLKWSLVGLSCFLGPSVWQWNQYFMPSCWSEGRCYQPHENGRPHRESVLKKKYYV